MKNLWYTLCITIFVVNYSNAVDRVAAHKRRATTLIFALKMITEPKCKECSREMLQWCKSCSENHVRIISNVAPYQKEDTTLLEKLREELKNVSQEEKIKFLYALNGIEPLNSLTKEAEGHRLDLYYHAAAVLSGIVCTPYASCALDIGHISYKATTTSYRTIADNWESALDALIWEYKLKRD